MSEWTKFNQITQNTVQDFALKILENDTSLGVPWIANEFNLDLIII